MSVPAVSVVMPSINISQRVVEEIIQTVPEGHQAWMGGDPLIEVPTLSHQPNNREINDLIGNSGKSINDKLKTGSQSELGSVLKGSPVKELRKAIGVNDRFVLSVSYSEVMNRCMKEVLKPLIIFASYRRPNTGWSGN